MKLKLNRRHWGYMPLQITAVQSTYSFPPDQWGHRDLWPLKSHQLMCESKWKHSLEEFQRTHFFVFCEVTVTLTFEHQIPINSSSSPTEHLHQIWGKSHESLLRYCVHKYGTDGWTTCRHQASGWNISYTQSSAPVKRTVSHCEWSRYPWRSRLRHWPWLVQLACVSSL